MFIKKSLKKILIISLTLVTAFLIFGCSKGKIETVSRLQVDVDYKKVTELADKDSALINKYLSLDSDVHINISRIQLLAETPDGITSLEDKSAVKVDTTKPSYEVTYVKDGSPLDFKLYIDATTGEVIGIRKN